MLLRTFLALAFVGSVSAARAQQQPQTPTAAQPDVPDDSPAPPPSDPRGPAPAPDAASGSPPAATIDPPPIAATSTPNAANSPAATTVPLADVDTTTDEEFDSPETAATERLRIHGYGNWRSGITSGDNAYLFGNPDGKFDSASFTLVQHASVLRSLRFVASQEIGIDQLGEEPEVDLDIVFAEWTATEWLDLLVGVGPFPVGAWTAVYDVGTLRPFLALPLGVYGFTGALGENLMGVQLRLHSAVGDSGILEFTLFGGAAQFGTELPFGVYALDDDATPEEIARVDEEREDSVPRLAGARLVFSPPVDGLTLGAGFYFGEQSHDAANEHGHQVVSGYISYSSDFFKLQLEYLYGALEHNQLHATYLEAAYMLTPMWQLAARGDLARFDLEADARAAPSLTEHLDLALGIACWVSADFLLKAAYHYVIGNMYARPHAEELYSAVRAGNLEDRTHYGELGMAFSF